MNRNFQSTSRLLRAKKDPFFGISHIVEEPQTFLKKRLTIKRKLLIESEEKTKGIEYFEYFHSRKASPWISNLDRDR